MKRHNGSNIAETAESGFVEAGVSSLAREVTAACDRFFRRRGLKFDRRDFNCCASPAPRGGAEPKVIRIKRSDMSRFRK